MFEFSKLTLVHIIQWIKAKAKENWLPYVQNQNHLHKACKQLKNCLSQQLKIKPRVKTQFSLHNFPSDQFTLIKKIKVT
jgi:hypothetical protein